MPRYYKRKTKKRQYKKKGGMYIQGSLNAMDVAKTAWKGVQYLKGLVNSELFLHEVSNNGANINWNGSITHMSAVAQGDGATARTGNSIFVRSIDLKGYVNIPGTATAALLRYMLIIDKQQIGDTAPVVTDVLEDVGQQVAPMSFLQLNTLGRFQILKTGILTLNNNGDTQKTFNVHIPLKHHIRYNGTLGTDVQKGGIYLLLISDRNGAGLEPNIVYNFRMRYHDN